MIYHPSTAPSIMRQPRLYQEHDRRSRVSPNRLEIRGQQKTKQPKRVMKRSVSEPFVEELPNISATNTRTKEP